MENLGNSCCHDSKCQCAKHIILAVLGIVLIVYVGVLTRNSLRSYDYIGKSAEIKDMVTFSGTGKVTAVPDVALISLGIVSEGATVTIAQKDSTDKMNRIIDALKNEFKIKSEDIKTQNYSVNPKYDWSNGRQNIIGYSVSQSASVKVRNFDQVGQIIAKATEIGANSVSGPQFTIDDPEKYREQARAKAVAEAKNKAKVLADQVGIKLGRIVNFFENSGDNVVMPMYDSLSMGMGGGVAEKAVPTPVVEAGSEEVAVSVSISYEIR